MKNLKLGLLSLVFLILLTSCKQSPINNPKKEAYEIEREKLINRLSFQKELKDKVKFGIVVPPENLNPFYAKDESSKIITGILYQQLFTIRESHNSEEYNYLLADSLSISEDGKNYVLKLKDNIFWHDGSRITVDDVIFSIDYTYNNNDTTYLDSFYVDGEEIDFKKISDDTVELNLSKPSYTLKYALEKLKVVPQKTFEKSPKKFTFKDKNFLIGSGPYVYKDKIKDEYFKVDEYNFEAFKEYFDGKSNIEKLSIRVVAHYSSPRYDMLDYNIQGGYILGSDSSAFVNDFYNIETIESGQVASLLFKMNNKTVSSPKMRKAISNLINVNSIASNFGDNTNVSRANSVFGHDNMYKSENNLINDMSIENAVEYIKSVQRKDDNFSIRLGFVLDPGEIQEKFAVYLQENLIAKGINLELVPLYEEEYVEELKDPNSDLFDICLFIYDSDKDPDYFKNFFKTDGIFNYSGYKNKDLDFLWEKARESSNLETRVKLYGEIQDTILRDKPIYPLLYLNRVLATDDRLTNVEEAMPSSYSFFTNLNRLKINEFKASDKALKKYDIKESDLKDEPRYDNVNIYNENAQPKKITKPEGAKELK